MANVGGFVSPGSNPSSGSGAAGGSLPTSTVELSISCSKLKDKDVTSTSDPICVLYQKSRGKMRMALTVNALHPKLSLSIN